jgi:hypothetical protein
VASYTELVWSSRDDPDPLLLVLVLAGIDAVAAEKPELSLFYM